MREMTTKELQRIHKAELEATITEPILITAYGKPVAVLVHHEHVDSTGILITNPLVDNALDSKSLTIEEKRALIAEIVRNPTTAHKPRKEYMELDSRLAGHFAPEKQELVITGDLQAERLKDAVKSALLEVIEERDRMISRYLPGGEPALITGGSDTDNIEDSPHSDTLESVDTE